MEDSWMSMVVVVVVVSTVVAAAAFNVQLAVTQSTLHVVGDSLGWDVPQNGTEAYINWASANGFSVGDILFFNFSTNQHDVQEVAKDSFDACTSSNPIGNLITTGPANVTLTSGGPHYFICTIGRHCQSGQKLAINVTGTPTAAPPSTNTPPNSPPAAPSPTSGATPEACPPVSSPESSTTPPTAGEPSTNSSKPEKAVPPPPNSSSAVFVSLFLTMMCIATAFFL